ncbi:hypothetical protein F2P79_025715 [Pimephales promelas]|nr:hypothetical protein F2P79_025715 [Pimephales promelas]
MTQITGLNVLNDCNENQKLLAKLPDWADLRDGTESQDTVYTSVGSFMDKTISERIKFVQGMKLCFGCLKPGHRSKECESRKICDTVRKDIQPAYTIIAAKKKRNVNKDW